MKKLLLAVFAFSLACNASAGHDDEAHKIYESLDLACHQCGKAPADAQEKCKAEVNLTKAKIMAINPGITSDDRQLKFFKCF
ncbi:MAG: hypothetical protein II922_02840 [Succinimonas sp.]|nr:hypothetical protein [Succinimonas sp.]